jgi:hypothetical protein
MGNKVLLNRLHGYMHARCYTLIGLGPLGEFSSFEKLTLVALIAWRARGHD